MINNWTFGRKLATGFAVMAVLALSISVVAVLTLQAAVKSQERVINVNAEILIETERMNTIAAQMAATVRGYLLSGEPRFEEQYRAHREDFAKAIARMHGAVSTLEGRRLLADTDRHVSLYREQADQLMALAATRPKMEVLVRQFDEKVLPARERVADTLRAMVAL
jgi:CHASE3 domain sensor protein